MAAVVEQVEHQRLTIFLLGGVALPGHTIGKREYALGDAQVRLIHVARAAQCIQDSRRIAPLLAQPVTAGCATNVRL